MEGLQKVIKRLRDLDRPFRSSDNFPALAPSQFKGFGQGALTLLPDPQIR